RHACDLADLGPGRPQVAHRLPSIYGRGKHGTRAKSFLLPRQHLEGAETQRDLLDRDLLVGLVPAQPDVREVARRHYRVPGQRTRFVAADPGQGDETKRVDGRLKDIRSFEGIPDAVDLVGLEGVPDRLHAVELPVAPAGVDANAGERRTKPGVP